MTIFDKIAKFLKEHEAPAELMDQVAFVKDQMAVLIRENATLKNKLSLRIAENKVLETQIKDLERAEDSKEGSESTGDSNS